MSEIDSSTNPIRVCQIMGNMNGGGVESVVLNYYRHINRDLVQFDFVVTESSTNVPQQEIEPLGGKIYTVPSYKNIFKFSKALSDLFLTHPEWKIVHSHMNALSVFPLREAKRAQVPVRIAHSHSTSGRQEPLKNLIKRALKGQANRFPTHKFACGECAGKWLFGNDAEFEIVFNAINLDHFAYSEDDRKAVRHKLGISDSSFVIGHIGRFVAQKNHVFLISIFEKVVKHFENAVLILVGSGENMDKIQNLVDERNLNKNVLFLGQIDYPEKIYQAFDIFVLPSLYEGLAMVCIEAQMSGLQCLISSEVTREVELTGNCVFLPIDNVDCWVEKIDGARRRPKRNRSDMDLTAFSNYEIQNQASHLQARYISLFEGIFDEI